MVNTTTVAKKDTRVSNAGKMIRILTKGRRIIEQEKGEKEWLAKTIMLSPTLSSYS